MALGAKRGLRFGADEAPLWLRLSAEVYSMRVDHLLGEVLRDFDLAREPAPQGQPSSTIAIRATLKPGRRHPALKAARIEFDGETKVVRKLVLDRTRLGQPVATVSYLLIDTRQQDDRLYALEGHLEAPYEVYTSQNEAQRRHWIARFFGPVLGDVAPGGPPPGGRPLMQRPFRDRSLLSLPASRPATRPSTAPATVPAG
jgi:hypothetical protein